MQKFYKTVFRVIGKAYVLVYIMYAFYMVLLQVLAYKEQGEEEPLHLLFAIVLWGSTLLLFWCCHGFLKRRQKKDAKMRAGHLAPKKQNMELMAWKKRAPLIDDRRILWCMFFILLYLFLQKFYMALALVPYLLFHILFYYLVNDYSARLFMKRLHEYVQTVTKYDDENGNTWNEVCHGVLMKDDTGKIPVTFSALTGQPTDIVILDMKTEILPHPKEVTEPKWAQIYLHAAFFVYVLQADKYAENELQKELETAIMHTHFQISKPIYIFLLGKADALSKWKERYDWLCEVCIKIVDGAKKVDMQYVLDDYRSRKWVHYEKLPAKKTASQEEYLLYTKLLEIEQTRDNHAVRRVLDYHPEKMWYQVLLEKVLKDDSKKFSCYDDRFFLRAFTGRGLMDLPAIDKNVFFRNYNKYSSYIYLTIPHQDMDYCFTPRNYYLCGFFHNMFRENERIPSVLAGFDYADLLLRFVLYHTAQKRGLIFDEKLVDDNLQFMGEKIFELVTKEDCIYRYVTTPVDVNVTLQNALLILGEYFPICAKGEKVTFLGLCTLLRVIRNQTRGHGSIREEISQPLWFSLYVLLVILGEMLRVQDFQIEVTEDGKILTGYFSEKMLYPMENYGYTKNGFPCILYGCSKNGREYINYFQGDIIVPEIISSEDE